MLDVQPLIDVREDEQFLGDKRDVEAALVYARRFAQEPTFKDRAEANAAADCIKTLKDVVKAAEEGRKKLNGPYEATVAATNRQYKELLSSALAAIEALTKKGAAFVRAERKRHDEERKAEEDRLAKEAEEKAAAAQAAAEEAEAKPQDPDAQKAAAEAHQRAAVAAQATPTEKVQPKQLRGDVSSFGTATTYDWEVTDLGQLPLEHHTFDKKSINAAVKREKDVAKAEGREVNLQCIPGLRMWPVERGVSRGVRS